METASHNGHVPDGLINGFLDWRREAMDDALRCRSEDGTPPYALLAAFQRHLPDHPARQFSENRPRTLQALRTLLSNLAPVLTPAHFTDSEEKSLPIFGWWRGMASDGMAFEIAQSPDCYGDADFIIAGPDEARVETLVRDVIADATRHTCRCLRYSGGVWKDAPETQAEVDATGFDDIVLPESLMTDIRTNIDAFFAQKELFHRLGFAWRRGILLVGPPGTGKTMVCKAAAQSHPEVPFLYVRDLRTGGHDALAGVFSRARRLAPCILAIEDMDGLVHKENRTMFLNELDGFKNNDGMLIIASSNHPERIDEALLKRPSRFDRVYHIGLPEKPERAEYTRRLLAKCPMPLHDIDTDDLTERIASATEGFTPAFLKEAFLSAALSAAQSGHTTLGPDFGDAIVEQVEVLKKYLKKARSPESFAEMLPSTGNEIGFRAR